MGEFGKSVLSALSSGFTGGLGSIVGSIGSAVSGGLGQLFKSAQDKREHEYFIKRSDYQQKLQKEIMDKQQQQAIDFWNMQNEYNDPTAVADRYRNAGINPLSAFGGSVVGLGASSAPMPSAGSAYGAGAGSLAPSMDSPASVAGLGVDVGELDLKGKDVAGLNMLRSAQTDVERAKVFLTRQQEKNAKQLFDHLEEKNPIELDQARQDYENSKALYGEISSRTAKNEEEKENLKVARDGMLTANAVATLQYAILKETGLRKANAEISQLYASARSLNADAEYKQASAEKVQQETLLLPAKHTAEMCRTLSSVMVDFSEVQLNNEERKKIAKEIEQIEVDNWFKFVDRCVDIYDVTLNEHWDRETEREKSTNKSDDSKRNALAGVLRTVILALITKGK